MTDLLATLFVIPNDPQPVGPELRPYFMGEVRDLTQTVNGLMVDLEKGRTLAPADLSDVMMRGVDCHLVADAGMRASLEYAYNREVLEQAGKPVASEIAMPVLTHIFKEAKRALHIQRHIAVGGDYIPRTKPLYASCSGCNDFHPLFP